MNSLNKTFLKHARTGEYVDKVIMEVNSVPGSSEELFLLTSFLQKNRDSLSKKNNALSFFIFEAIFWITFRTVCRLQKKER